MTDFTGYQWRAVGPEHPQAAELVPVDDWRIHGHGPGCPCGPDVAVAPDQVRTTSDVGETWLHRRMALPDTIKEMKSISEKITTVEELDALLSQAGQNAEPLVVREGFRIWILTEDESGQWWAWSWREEGESANPVHAEALTLPLTLLHPLPDAPTPSTEDRESLARVLRDANERDLGIPEDSQPVLDWEDWLPETDAALAWFATRQPSPVDAAALEGPALRRIAENARFGVGEVIDHVLRALGGGVRHDG